MTLDDRASARQHAAEIYDALSQVYIAPVPYLRNPLAGSVGQWRTDVRDGYRTVKCAACGLGFDADLLVPPVRCRCDERLAAEVAWRAHFGVLAETWTP